MKGMPTADKPKAHYPRRVHDFSARRVYTSKAGMIEPVKPIHMLPNEHIDIDVDDFLQSMPMTTAPFLRGRKEFAFYYVPYVQLWQNYGQYQTGRADPFSSSLKGSKYEPRISLRMLYELVFLSMLRSMQYECYLKWMQVSNGNPLITDVWNDMCDDIFVDCFTNDSCWLKGNLDSNDIDLVPFLKRLGYLSSSGFFDDHMSNKFIDVSPYDDEVFEPTGIEFILDQFHQQRWSNWARKLDLLRYGNMLPFLSPAYDAFLEWMEEGWTTDEDTNSRYRNIFLRKIQFAAQQIMCVPVTYYVSVYPLLAYNKVFYTYFRNTYYDLNYYVGDYNVDHLECTDLQSSILTNDKFSLRFLDIEQHQWKKDMFTSLMPDTQFGAVSSLQLDVSVDLSFNGVVSTNRQSDFYVPNSGTSAGDNTDIHLHKDSSEFGSILTEDNAILQHWHSFDSGALNDYVTSSAGSASFDVLALRRAEAIQGYRQTLLRCGNKTKDIMVGIYGVEPRWENDHDPAFVDAFGYDVFVDRITSSAETNSDPSTYNGKLGDLGGQIAKLGQSRHSIKFTSGGDFGVLLPVCYIVFNSEYNSYNIDPNLLNLTPEEHYIPDFQDLGFVPVTRRTLSLLDPRVSKFDQPITVNEDVDQVLGYGTPYFEKKLDIDLVHGILCNFHAVTDSERVLRVEQLHEYYGDFSHWVSPRTDLQSVLNTQIRQFYIDPRILNVNFLLASDGRQETDQFINNTYFKVRRTNTLTDLGLPKF